PAVSDEGYVLEEIGDRLFWLADGFYQMMFLITDDGVIAVDAPPTRGHNIRRAIRKVTKTEVTHAVLLEDPDLAEAIPEPTRARAIKECNAAVVRLHRGNWNGQLGSLTEDGIGLLVLEGLLLRRVGIDGRFGAELLGEGDILRPWQGADTPTLPRTTGWRAIEPARLAILDQRAAYRLARYPELTGRLVARALERSRNLAVKMAIVHQPRVDTRLLMLVWRLAARWGKVRPDGYSLSLRLTHTVLADLVAARRPTVSTALSDLAEQNLLLLRNNTWLVTGHPPGELLVLEGPSQI
ncbi:MAG: helix-turn-helix domain-containing protein, partial [Solirubrobacteraceae bacterium]